MSSNLINVGQELTIPGVAPSDQTNTTYVVQKGDTLYSIASAYNTTVDELANLNDLDNDLLTVGQTLQIPSTGNNVDTNVTGTNMYIVQKGDTLYSVALKYNTTVDAIKNKNNLTSNILSVGQTLIIPADTESTGQDTTPSENINGTYVVQKGDSLWSIANRFGVTVNELIAANDLKDSILTIGQVLIIPDQDVVNDSTNSNLYIVQKGDSLWSIANRFGVSVNSIRMINNLTSDILSIGQTLIIP